MVTKDTLIEDLVKEVPGAVRYLMQKKIKCLACGEPVWGTLADAARGKGYNEDEIDRIVQELNELS
jgi:hypothetical protein